MFDHDIFGHALMDYAQGKTAQPLILHNSYSTAEEMPVDIFFRKEDDLTELEEIALSLCDGLVLDIGAGTGTHAFWLQQRNQQVHALEQSPLACQWMLKQGILHVIAEDFFNFKPTVKYNTLLFLMNGIGITGTILGFENFLSTAKEWLGKNGQLIFDSSDIGYLYEDVSIPKPKDRYHGEITYQYEYKGTKDKPFNWLYLDINTLIHLGHKHQWVVQVLYEDDMDQYLVRMEPRL